MVKKAGVLIKTAQKTCKSERFNLVNNLRPHPELTYFTCMFSYCCGFLVDKMSGVQISVSNKPLYLSSYLKHERPYLDSLVCCRLTVFSSFRMWTELPQTLCVQDPQQLHRRQEETAVQRLAAGRHLVHRSPAFHRVYADAAGGGMFSS